MLSGFDFPLPRGSYADLQTRPQNSALPKLPDQDPILIFVIYNPHLYSDLGDQKNCKATLDDLKIWQMIIRKVHIWFVDLHL